MEKICAFFRYCLVFLAIVLPYFRRQPLMDLRWFWQRECRIWKNISRSLFFSQISPDMKKETIKAQTVIARSNIQRWLGEGKNLAEILRENGSTEEVWRYFFAEKRQIYEQAVKETDGQVLTYEGKVRLTPWHKRSAGKTRSGEEAFHDEAYTYLKSADSSEDEKSPDRIKNRGNSCGAAFRGAEDRKKRDSAGYVTELTIGETLLEGESFAAGMGLESANFSLKKRMIFIICECVAAVMVWDFPSLVEMRWQKTEAVRRNPGKYFPEMELKAED